MRRSTASTFMTALLVDDEPLALEGLQMRLADYDSINIVGTCSDGGSALLAIQQLQPDVVFLDIEMPGMDGLDLIRHMQAELQSIPRIVFVTAYKEFALQAFEYRAFDYLLKPTSAERVASCVKNLEQAHMQHQALDRHSQLSDLLSKRTGKSLDGFINTLAQPGHTSVSQLQQTISLKSGSEWVRIQLDTILWIEAAGDYMCVHTSDGNHIIRKTLKTLEQELDPERFPRVNRSAIVNLDKVTRLSPNSNGEYIALLCSGSQVKVGRKYKVKLDELNRSLSS